MMIAYFFKREAHAACSFLSELAAFYFLTLSESINSYVFILI
jgi:hypothetical protein